MATGLKRPTRRTRHLLRRLPREKYASVQRAIINELMAGINKTGRSRHGALQSVPLGTSGSYRPLNHRVKALIRRLRRAKVWAVQRAIVQEIAHLIEREKRRIDRVRQSQAAKQARAAATRAGIATGRRVQRAARATPGAARVIASRGQRAQIRVGRFWSYVARPGQAARLARDTMTRKRSERQAQRIGVARLRMKSGAPLRRDRKLLERADRTRKPAGLAAPAGNGTKPAPAARIRRAPAAAQVPPLPSDRIRPARASRAKTSRTRSSK